MLSPATSYLLYLQSVIHCRKFIVSTKSQEAVQLHFFTHTALDTDVPHFWRHKDSTTFSALFQHRTNFTGLPRAWKIRGRGNPEHSTMRGNHVKLSVTFQKTNVLIKRQQADRDRLGGTWRVLGHWSRRKMDDAVAGTLWPVRGLSGRDMAASWTRSHTVAQQLKALNVPYDQTYSQLPPVPAEGLRLEFNLALSVYIGGHINTARDHSKQQREGNLNG